MSINQFVFKFRHNKLISTVYVARVTGINAFKASNERILCALDINALLMTPVISTRVGILRKMTTATAILEAIVVTLTGHASR